MKKNFSNILNILNETQFDKVMIIGDIILDKYIYGNVRKVSSGIKIPIIEKENIYYRLGGAGNVAMNISKFSKNILLIGMHGKCSLGRKIDEICKKNNIKIFTLKSKKTLLKERIYIDNQQVVRVDDYDNTEIKYDKIEEQIYNFKPKIVIIVDYGYGVVSQKLINIINEYNKQKKIEVFFSSRNIDKFKLNEMYIMVVNNNEFKDSLNNKKNKKFITNGKEGIRYINNETVINRKSYIKYNNPINVSGAGDSVLAILALFYSKVKNIKYLMDIANIAGSIAVSNKLTYGVNKYEIISEFYKQKIKNNNYNKILGLKDSLTLIENWKKNNKIIVFTNGCYDILHAGHLKLFNHSKKYGNKLVVGINSDDSIKKIKGSKRPINKLSERILALSFIKQIDLIIIFNEETATEVIKKIKPDIYIKGSEYKNIEIEEIKYVKKIKYIPMIKDISTSNIINKIIRITDDEK